MLALLQDNCFDLCFLAQVVCMREEYISVLSTSSETDSIGRFGRYQYISKNQISADITVYLCRRVCDSLCFEQVTATVASKFPWV